MSKWQRTLDLKDAWKKADNREIPTGELAKVISERLLAIQPLGIRDIDDKLIILATEFKFLGDEEDLTFKKFDSIMTLLYDWGDISLDDKFGGKRVCWIKTRF